ncbi:phage terminase small subunit P27 family [Candidatus Parcubacteria bacterium]|nr:MAG: phage terminase small subunit P27 family [Candidatus Parcubacteria bacterium]
MGKRGPAPKPTALRKFEGNPSGRPFNENEPKPQIAYNAPAPAEFNEWQTNVWNHLVEMLTRIGIFTEADYNLLVRYVDTLWDWKEAAEFLREKGMTYAIFEPQEYEEDGTPKPRRLKYIAQFPQVSIKRNLGAALLKMEQQLGMTPAARTNLIAVASNIHDKTDPFAV